jgi:putative transposase
VSCYRLIDAEKAHHRVSHLARVLGVARAGYYAWASRPPSDRDHADALLGEQIRQIHARSRGTYGAPRVHAELRLGLDIRVGRKRVARLMREHGLQGVHRRRRHGTTRRDPQASPASDLVERDFKPTGPNRLWVADITQQRTGEGWLYLAVILDAFSRRSWAGRWPSTCAPDWSWTHSTWPWPNATPMPASCITATTAASTPRSPSAAA